MYQQMLNDIDVLTPEREGMLSDLNSWATLQGLLQRLEDEDTVIFLMKAELQNKNRIRILDRLYSRFNVLRRERERRNLSRGILPGNSAV